MQSLNLIESQREEIEGSEKVLRKPFWKRQFQIEATAPQKFFDGFFGIVLPSICFFFDPMVFRYNGLFEPVAGPMAGAYKPFAYILSFSSIMILLAFLLWGKKLKWLNGFTSGIFAVGAIVALVVGIGLFPFSVMGLMILIGALGFTPFFTAFVYWRNAVRASKTALPELGSGLLARMIILAGMFTVVVPLLVNAKIQNGLNTLQNGNADEIRQTAQRMKYVAPLVDFSRLYLRNNKLGYSAETEENQALAESYKMLTGKEILIFHRRDVLGR